MYKTFTYFVCQLMSARLIFQDGNPNGNLTQDALNVCTLLAINPIDITNRELSSFEQPGMSKQRVQLQYDYYMEKKQLKMKAIENILIKCQQGKQGSSSEEARHMLALLDDIKNVN